MLTNLARLDCADLNDLVSGNAHAAPTTVVAKPLASTRPLLFDKEDDTLTLHELFSKQAKRTPGALAVVDGNRQLTYQELDELSTLLAVYLRSIGVVVDAVVGICMERCAEYIIAVLGILKAGGAYCPFEITYPAELMANVASDVSAVTILTNEKFQHLLPTNQSSLLMDPAVWNGTGRESYTLLNAEWASDIRKHRLALELEEFEQNTVEPDLNALCYVVYSSGTTGRPKGIRCSHAGPVYSYLWRQSFLENQCVRVAHNIYFVWEAIRPLIRGGESHIIPDKIIYEPFALADYIEEFKIEQTLFTPSLMETILNSIDQPTLRQKFKSLKVIWLNGEVITEFLRDRVLSVIPDVKAYNLYSISECADVAVLDLNDPWDPSYQHKVAPVGHPMTYCTSFVFDPNMNMVPDGEAGELYIGGGCLARDYLHRPDLTASRFVQHPKEPTERLYRTGDKARILPNGAIEILGRVDLMVVRIRGNFIDITCVERAILSFVAVKGCAVTAHGEEGDDKRIVAYIIPDSDASIEECPERLNNFHVDPATGSCTAIRAHLSRHLPHYMIPSVYVEISSMPHNPTSGKTNVNALPPPPHRTGTKTANVDALINSLSWASPEDDVLAKERALSILFEGILNIEHGSVDSTELDFFDLGGHSLSAARLLSSIKRLYGSQSLTMVGLLKNSTICKMARLIDRSCRALTLDAPTDSAASGESESVANIDETKVEAILLEIKRDTDLASELHWNKNSSPCLITPFKKATSIFLTGATGFVGSFLLQELLIHTAATITCLVRMPRRSAHRSVEEVLSAILKKHKICENVEPGRIRAVEGDLSFPHFGLDEQTWRSLSDTTDHVVHSGAAVNLFLPYSALRKPNVLGTMEVLKLLSEGQPKGLCYVSTNAVCPTRRRRCSETDELSEVLADLDSGYAQSKWAAEQLVIKFAKLGAPCSIFRLGNVAGHSTTGTCNIDDFQLLLLAGSVAAGAYPIINNWAFEWTPVDHVVNCICEVFGQSIRRWSSESSLDEPHNFPAFEFLANIYHLVNPVTIDSSLVFSWLGSRGYTMKAVPFRGWVESLRETFRTTIESDSSKDEDELTENQVARQHIRKLGGLIHSLETMGEEFLTVAPHFDQRNFLQDLESAQNVSAAAGHASKDFFDPPRRATISTAHLDSYLSYLSNDNIRMFPTKPVQDSAEVSGSDSVTSPTKKKRGKLFGKIAIVTGASSGIGAAIARSLASEGCAVSLAARRSEKLKEVANTFPPGARFLCTPTDVTRRSQVKHLAAVTASEFGRPADIIVNAAGVMYFTLMKNLFEDDWERTIDVCVKGTLNGIGAVLKDMIDRGSGTIVNISSDAGRKTFPGLTVYSGAKFAVEAISQGLRLETANTGVKVISIQPGNVATDLLSISTDQEGLSQYGTPSGAKVLDPEDIASAVLFAVTQPEHSAVNEILIEPREEPA